jgi:serine/threonine protein kinase
MQLKRGTILKGGEFIIIDVLGKGGFGITYLAIQSGLNRKVAVKEFFMEDFCNRDEETSAVSVPSVGSFAQVMRFKTQFLKEAQTIATLNHPNIIKIISVFEENGTAYYVMEYVDGGSLDKMSTPQAPMSEAQAVNYVIQIAEALDYLHDNNILHLDVKPANILVCNGKAVLIDFGISKRYDPAYGEQTSTNVLAISEGYAPLEQYTKEGVAHFTPAADVYSLGATLYKLVTGNKPSSAGELAVAGNGPEIPEHVSPHVADAIRAAMAPSAAKRLQSMSAFVAKLKADDDQRTKIINTPPVKPDVTPPPVKPDVTPPPPPVKKQERSGGFMKWLIIVLLVVVAGIAAIWGYGVYSENKMEKTVGSFMQYIADEWMAEDPEGAVNALIEYGDWYGEQSTDDQLKIDRIEQEWMDANPYEDMLLDEFWEYLEQEEVV